MFVIMQSSAFLPTPSPGAGAVEYLVAKLALELAEGHKDIGIALLCLEGSMVEHKRVYALTVPAQGSVVAREGVLSRMASRIFRGEEGWNKLVPPEDFVLFDHSLHQLTQRRLPEIPAVTMSHGMAPLSPWSRNPVFTSEHHGRLHGLREARALHNGIDVEEVPFVAAGARDDVLVWAGRIMAYKRPHIAAEVARSTGMKLLLAGPVIEADYATRLQSDDNVLLLGELGHEALLKLLGSARALLFTSDASEPAGIVLLEAQAAGTPVIAFDHGANREFTAPGTRLVATQAEMVAAVLDRSWEGVEGLDIRRWVAENRSIASMAEAAHEALAEALGGERW